MADDLARLLAGELPAYESPPSWQNKLAMNTTPVPGYPSEPVPGTPEQLRQRREIMEFLNTLPGHRDGVVDPLQGHDWFSHREPDVRDLMRRRREWLDQQRPYPGYPAYEKR